MVMDVTEPIPALVLTPTRLLRLAMLVGASGVAALLVAVGVLVWTYAGLTRSDSQPTVPADVSSRPVAAAPAGALAPERAPAPVEVPAAAPAVPPPAAAPAAAANSEILRNPAMAAIAPTAATPSYSAPVSSSGPTSSGIPTVRLPGSSVPTVDWNAAGQSLGLQNVNWPALLWASGAGGGGGVPTGAIIGSATAIGTSIGNNAFDLVNTLLLLNSGFYGGRPSTNIPGVGLPGPEQLAAAMSVIPQVGLPQLPKVGLPGLPGPPNVGLPNVGLPKLGPPKIGLPKLPKLGLGVGIPGTPIGIGF